MLSSGRERKRGTVTVWSAIGLTWPWRDIRRAAPRNEPRGRVKKRPPRASGFGSEPGIERNDQLAVDVSHERDPCPLGTTLAHVRSTNSWRPALGVEHVMSPVTRASPERSRSPRGAREKGETKRRARRLRRKYRPPAPLRWVARQGFRLERPLCAMLASKSCREVVAEPRGVGSAPG